MTTPKNNKPVSYLKQNIKDFTTNAAGTNLAEVQNWLHDEHVIDKFHLNLKKEQEVYTLLYPENSKKIHTFFYPTKVVCPDKIEIELDQIIKSNGSNGILINGRLGQGKSILLKYLQFLELNIGASIPILLELRKIKNPNNILDMACEKINNLGLPCSKKLFDFLLYEGKISLFLDGFDELALDIRSGFNESLSTICTRNPAAKVIVTSRHNTEISKNTAFKNYTISLLQEVDVAPFIKKILIKEELYNPIISKIKESKEFDLTVLDTPLLLTWFIVVYNKRFKIPKTKLGFYEDLFGAILSRHDGLKESYNRASKSRLNDDELKNVFSVLCYLSRKEQVSVFTKEQIHSFIQRALNISDYEKVKPIDYLYDLTHVTCLLKIDGIDYEFIHETVTQYFSACFVKSSSDDNAQVFYGKRLTDWRIFEDELIFLEDIDTIRYTKHFLLPNIDIYLKKDEDEKPFIDAELLNLIFSSSFLAFAKENDVIKFVTTISPHSNEYVLKKAFKSNQDQNTIEDIANEIISKIIIKVPERLNTCIEFIANNEVRSIGRFVYLDFKPFLEQLDILETFYQSMNKALIPVILANKEKCEGLLAKEKQKEGLF